MSFEIPDAFVKQYHANIQLLTQQKNSRFRGKVRVETQAKATDFYDRIGATAARKRLSRHADTPRMDTPHDRRAVFITPYDWADLIDQEDKVKLIADPTSAYSMNAASAMGRAMDDVIIEAAFGTAKSGAEGATDVAFPAGQIVGAGSANLTTDKLISTLELFNANDVDEDIKKYIAIGAKQVTSLLKDAKYGSADYNMLKPLQGGQIVEWMGFTIMRTERLTKTGNNRACLAWAEDGLLLAVGADLQTRVSERADKNYATQVFCSMQIGATRMEEKKVVQVLCDETA